MSGGSPFFGFTCIFTNKFFLKICLKVLFHRGLETNETSIFFANFLEPATFLGTFVLFFADNYILSGLTAGQYALYSPVQTENGPRLFYSLFGFWYKGKNTRITARLFRTTQTFDLTPSPNIFADDLRWMYFSENITTILKSTSWASYSDKEWQVKTKLNELV